MKTVMLGVVLFLSGTLGCALLTPANVKLALDASQIACLMTSTLTDSKALADACAVDQALVPVIEKLIAQREAAKRSGVRWAGDAGSP